MQQPTVVESDLGVQDRAFPPHLVGLIVGWIRRGDLVGRCDPSPSRMICRSWSTSGTVTEGDCRPRRIGDAQGRLAGDAQLDVPVVVGDDGLTEVVAMAANGRQPVPTVQNGPETRRPDRQRLRIVA
jgi:hypothetical protein